jgi:hypothetical protein
MKRAYMDHAATTQAKVMVSIGDSLAHLPPAVENYHSFSPVWRQNLPEAAGAPR